VRLLIIDEDPRYRALLQHHAACRWASATSVEYDPIASGTLPRDIRAHGFDAVLLSASDRLEWLADLARRPGFAPIVYFAARGDEGAARRALALGACVVLEREKVDHGGLIEAIGAAAARQARSRAERAADGRDAARFGSARIPGYHCIRRLARGHSTELYLAESEREPRLVVIKVARDRLEQSELDPSFKRFLLEHETVQRIKAPCVVRVYDLGVSDEHAYLVMEYFARGNLGRRIRAGVSAADALRFALEIACALQAVHEAGVIHRDLKPGNVMVREDGSLALIDFGLALRMAVERDAADRQLICGTPHYMSPEQGHAEPVDPRSDLYSLGVILYEMLVGRKPYTAVNSMAVIYLHRKAPLPTLPEPLAWLEPLLERLLGKAPADRFESARAAAEALQRALEELYSDDAAAAPPGNNSLQAPGRAAAKVRLGSRREP
jgi:eukaryotic-like serine/threonine-protein kinase